jgi:hypothetical protein
VNNHSTKFIPVPALALARHADPVSVSGVICALALAGCAPRHVATSLDRSEDLVRRWGRGQGSPSLAQILQAPARFGLRLLALAGQVLEGEVIEVPATERLRCLMVALGSLLATSQRPLDQHSDEELRRQAEDARRVAREAEALAQSYDRLLAAREIARRELRSGGVR